MRISRELGGNDDITALEVGAVNENNLEKVCHLLQVFHCVLSSMVHCSINLVLPGLFGQSYKMFCKSPLTLVQENAPITT